MEIKNSRKCSVLIVMLLLFIVKYAKSDELPIQIESQQTDSWCWAASVTVLLNRYLKYPGIDVAHHQAGYFGQCQLVTKMFELDGINIDCCVPGNEEVCEEGAYDADTQKVVNSYPYNMNMSVEGWLLDQDIDTLINVRKAPFIMGLENANSAHNIVGMGLSTDKKKLRAMDPWDGLYHVETIENWKNGNTYDGRPWKSTLDWVPTSTAPIPPSDVKLRHTIISSPNEYSFVSLGKITTESFTVKSGAKIKLLASLGDPIVMKKGANIKKGAKLCASSSSWCTY
jgi:hypothetical protein